MKKLNINELLWEIIMVLLFLGIGRLLVTGKLKFFLHPKMIKFVLFSEAVLLILIFYQSTKTFRRENTVLRCGYAVFLIPIMIMAANPTYLDSSAVANKSWNAKGNQGLASNEPLKEKAQDFSDKTAAELGIGIKRATEEENRKDPFLTDLDEIYEFPSSKGKEYTLEGFVFRDKSFSKNQILVGRMIVTCCIADSMVDGVICEVENAESYKNNEWVRVTGTIEPLQNSGLMEMGPDFMMKLSKIEKIAPYDSPYVYYY